MSKFKKIISAMLMAIMAIAFTQGLASCSSKEKRFESAIEQLNKQLPMNLGNGMSLQKVTTDNNELVYNVKCREQIIDLDLLEESKDELKAGSIAQLKNEKKASKDFATLLEYCQEKGMKIVYRYKGSNSDKSVDITIDSKEI